MSGTLPRCDCTSGPIPPSCRPNDTHVCTDDKDHDTDHTCACGVRWFNPEASVHVTTPYDGQ